MKKLSVLTFFLYCAIASFSQGFPNNLSTSNNQTLFHYKGGLKADVGFVNTRYPDTATANLTYIAGEAGAQIIVGDTIYMRNTTATKWIVIGSGSIVVNGDTTYVELPLYVDTTGGIRTLKIFHPDGYEGGIVTYTGTGFDFNVSPITLYLNNKVFLFPEKTITLSPPNSLPRYDIFGVDSLGAFVKSGDTSSLPIEPQIGVDSFALTKAFLISPGDTAPSNITTSIIYDENTEWTTGTQGSISVVDFDNADNPLHLTKDIFISKYRNNSQLYFVNGSYAGINNTPQSVLLLPIYLNAALSASNNIYISLYDTLTSSTKLYRLGSSDNFNKNEVNTYQTVVIPTNNFTWVNNKSTFTTLLVTFTGYDTSGAKGLYMDYIRLQKGLSQTGNGSCPLCIVDIHVTADSMYQVSIRQNGDTASLINWTGGGGTDTSHLSDRINEKLNISDTASMLSPYQKAITLTTTGTSGAATLTGSTLNIPNYGGGSAIANQTVTAESDGQTTFTFTDVPASTNSYNIYVNGCLWTDGWEASDNDITLTATDISVGDKVTLVFK